MNLNFFLMIGYFSAFVTKLMINEVLGVDVFSMPGLSHDGVKFENPEIARNSLELSFFDDQKR